MFPNGKYSWKYCGAVMNLKPRVCSLNFLLREIIYLFNEIYTCIWKVKLNVGYVFYLKKGLIFRVEGSIKYFEYTSRIGMVGWRQTNNFLSLALWRRFLEANKKQVPVKSYSLKIRTDSVNQICSNKEKVK